MVVVRLPAGANIRKEKLSVTFVQGCLIADAPNVSAIWGWPVRPHLFVGRLAQRDPILDQYTYIPKHDS